MFIVAVMSVTIRIQSHMKLLLIRDALVNKCMSTHLNTNATV